MQKFIEIDTGIDPLNNCRRSTFLQKSIMASSFKVIRTDGITGVIKIIKGLRMVKNQRRIKNLQLHSIASRAKRELWKIWAQKTKIRKIIARVVIVNRREKVWMKERSNNDLSEIEFTTETLSKDFVNVWMILYIYFEFLISLLIAFCFKCHHALFSGFMMEILEKC